MYYTHTRDRVHSRARFSPFTLTSHGWAECVGKRIVLVVLRERCHNRSRYAFPRDGHYYVFHDIRTLVRPRSRPVRPFPDEIERTPRVHSLILAVILTESRIALKDLVAWRTVRVWSMASATPAATLVQRWLTVWPSDIYSTRWCTRLPFFLFPFFPPPSSFLSLSLSFLLSSSFFFSISLTCAAVETSTTSYRCQRCARSSPATACARTVADPVARWTAACSSRAGGRTRRRLFARGRPCQPSWPSFRWIEIAATGWTALQTTVAVAPRDGACRFRHPLFLHSGHESRDQRADPINTCPPRIRGRTVRTVPRAPRHEPPTRTRRNVGLGHLSAPPVDSKSGGPSCERGGTDRWICSDG